jgi:hypothetical protein
MTLPVSLLPYDSGESLQLTELLKEYENLNCFNPGLIFLDDRIIISFRAYPSAGQTPFHSYLLFYNKTDCSVKVIDLSQHYSNYGIDNVADPKLTVLNGEIWVTFNTGYSKIENKLYIAQVFPALQPPYLCQYPSRQRIEKNWSFFFDEGKLKALYSIFPLSILAATEKNESKKTIDFAPDFTDRQDNPSDGLRHMTIGTQAVFRNGGLCLMAHEKKYFWGKRIYLGVPVRIIKTGNHFTRMVSNKRFIHSYRSLLGSLKKYNVNLWSCTYFSGLQIIADNRVILAYGINDRKFAFKEIPFDKLWEPAPLQMNSRIAGHAWNDG